MFAKQMRKDVISSLMLLFFVLSLLSGPLFSQEKKLRVTAETAKIYLKPDPHSPVVATVNEGTVLTLRNPRKTKRIWYQVYFVPEGSKVGKSGYIQDSFVERLFVVTKIETIDSEEDIAKHFRKAQWGMTQEQVVRLEGNPAARESPGEYYVMRYWDSIKDMSCWIDYMFKDDKLVRARYIFLVKHEYKSQYFGDYKKAKDFLTEVHGQSPLTNINWLNPTYKEDYSNWGLAVSLGHLEYSAIWDTEETEIVLRLFGENNEVKLVAEYTGKLEEEKEKEQLTKGIRKRK
ncbi:MAG: hypothetical protein JSV46_06370 [Candidatus Aminicenantes bacterium]|nr:MAG: hypothetical protein JSV46_06370 [Candidatus Aminicenantes bacterium]